MPDEIHILIMKYVSEYLYEIPRWNPKIKKWIFGHTHQSHNTSNDGIQYICNPRGRPDDFNRLEYKPITIEFI